MAVSYDFDIHWILPQDVLSDPKIAKLMGDIGFKQDARANYVALFRDPNTVERLRGADEKVRRWLEKSGFGLNTYDSGVGPGRYPAKDETARLDVIDRLSKAMKGADLKGADFNGFHLQAFLKAVVEAKPVGEAAATMQEAGTAESPPRQAAAAVPASKARAVPKPAMPAMATAGGSSIDAAFANPKSGAPVTARNGREPTVDDLLEDPSIYGRTLDPVSDEFGPGGIDDLKYRPATQSQTRTKAGIPMLPFMMVAVVMVVFLMVAVQ